MKKIKKNITLLNIISNIVLQFVTIISGFIVPRIILGCFGSEVNGLVSSLNQFLSYINIFEGGLGGVVLANLYKPLCNKDNDSISSIVKTTHNFYHKLSLLLILYTVVLATIYPIVTHTSFSFMYIFSITLILSFTLFIQYNFSLSYRLLLQADKKVYIVSFTQVLLTILNVVIFILFSNIFPSIHVLKLLSALIFLLQPIIFNYFVKKYYSLTKNVKPDSKLLNERWNGFAINIAAFIHNNTDITILTLFSDLKMVSVYAVYALVTNGLKKLIQSISSAINPTIGHAYAKGGKEELESKFELYEYLIFVLSFFLFTVGGLLITPFVQIYTSTITDANYYQPLFGVLLVLSELMYCLREPYVNLAYSANKFKDIKKHAYLESAINIIVSLLLVRRLGIVGIAIGTLLAMTYRTIYHVVYLKKNVLNRRIWVFTKKMLSFVIVSVIGILICYYCFPITGYDVKEFLYSGIIYSIIIGVLYLFLSVILFKKDLLNIKKVFLKS